MRDYGRVFCALWLSHDFRSLSEDGRTLVLYLLTCQHATMTGAFSLPDGYICEDLQWSVERVSKGFTELFRNGFANRCGTVKWVWIRKFLEWNKPENPNQWKAARKMADKVPSNCSWADEFAQVFAEAAGDPPPTPRNPSGTVTQTVSKPVSVSVSGTVGDALSETPPDTTSTTGADAGGETGVLFPAASPATRARTFRGTRLPEDFSLTTERRAVAVTEAVDPARTFAKFCDYWRGVSGAKGTKLDWDATWRNWCRAESERNPRAKGGGDNGLPTFIAQ